MSSASVTGSPVNDGPDSLSGLYNRYANALYNYGAGLGFPKDTCMDAIHDVFCKLTRDKAQERFPTRPVISRSAAKSTSKRRKAERSFRVHTDEPDVPWGGAPRYIGSLSQRRVWRTTGSKSDSVCLHRRNGQGHIPQKQVRSTNPGHPYGRFGNEHPADSEPQPDRGQRKRFVIYDSQRRQSRQNRNGLSL